MATLLQRKALDKLVENGRRGKKLSVSATMREVGYSPRTAVEPGKLTESKGFKELREELGLTDSFLTKALVADIKKKPGKRYKELELGFKVSGRLKEEKDAPTFNFNFFSNEQAKRIAARIVAGDSAIESAPDRLSDSDKSEI